VIQVPTIPVASVFRSVALTFGLLAILYAAWCGVYVYLRLPGSHQNLADIMYDDIAKVCVPPCWFSPSVVKPNERLVPSGHTFF
jgi:hypothetical protein